MRVQSNSENPNYPFGFYFYVIIQMWSHTGLPQGEELALVIRVEGFDSPWLHIEYICADTLSDRCFLFHLLPLSAPEIYPYIPWGPTAKGGEKV